MLMDEPVSTMHLYLCPLNIISMYWCVPRLVLENFQSEVALQILIHRLVNLHS